MRLNQDLRHKAAGRKHNHNETVQKVDYLIDVKLSGRFRCNTFCGTTNLLETKRNENERSKTVLNEKKINVIITAILSYLFCVSQAFAIPGHPGQYAFPHQDVSVFGGAVDSTSVPDDLVLPIPPELPPPHPSLSLFTQQE